MDEDKKIMEFYKKLILNREYSWNVWLGYWKHNVEEWLLSTKVISVF